MTQNRQAPAYQEYAASLIARAEYRMLSMEGRAMFITLRLECWVNGSVPSEPMALARLLGFSVEQVERGLAEVVGPFYSAVDGRLRCPELDDYRAHIEDRRRKLSEGGKAGAAKTNNVHSGPRSSRPTTTPRPARGLLVKQSPVQSNTEKSLDGRAIDGTWVGEYEVSEYEKQSKGH